MVIFVFSVVGLMFAANAVNAEQIHTYRMCKGSKCGVRDVFIDPCLEASENQPCELPKGINASITFKYTPQFGSDSPQTRLYAETFLFDLPFYDMNTNACLYTNCPMVKNTEQNWLYNLFISTNYPSASFTIKLKLWDGGPEAQGDDQCCFKFDIKIV